ncbi:MAG: hypothetical protein HQ579_02225 [Candidatus Omnitrophica bacterium]|nr:hypothetical protein [Candidatus Omnitrophota bacterium]
MKKIVLISLLIICTTLSSASHASANSSSDSEPPLRGTIFQRMTDALKRMGRPEKNTKIKQENLFEQSEKSITGYIDRTKEEFKPEPETGAN